MPKRALLSVDDPRIVDLANLLVSRQWEVLSLKRTADLLNKHGIPHTRIEKIQLQSYYDLFAVRFPRLYKKASREEIDVDGLVLVHLMALSPAPAIVLAEIEELQLADFEDVVAQLRSTNTVMEDSRKHLAHKAIIAARLYTEMIEGWIFGGIVKERSTPRSIPGQ